MALLPSNTNTRQRSLGAVQPFPGGGSPYGAGIQQPVQGAPTPVQSPAITSAPAGGGASQAAGPLGPGGPTPNPFNLPPDLAPNYGDAVYQDIENAQQRAIQGNIQRLNEAKAGYKQLEQDYATREQDLLGNLQGLGQVQRDDLSRQFEQEKAGLTQDMINRGIYSTTTAMQQERGLASQQQQRQLRLEDMLTREKMDYAKALSAETLGARGQSGYLGLLERVNETGPDPNMAAQLGQAIGAGQTSTPDYLSALGGGTPQAPAGPKPPSAGLGRPGGVNYSVSVPRSTATSIGGPSIREDSPFLSERPGGISGSATGAGQQFGGDSRTSPSRQYQRSGQVSGGSGTGGAPGVGPGGSTDPGRYTNPVPGTSGTGTGKPPVFTDQDDFDNVMDIGQKLGVDEATIHNFYSWIRRYANDNRPLTSIANDSIVRAMAPASYIPILDQLRNK